MFELMVSLCVYGIEKLVDVKMVCMEFDGGISVICEKGVGDDVDVFCCIMFF